ncbi:MAG: cation:proton antiporter [Gammaproteobacteria bacterium SHHR-1]
MPLSDILLVSMGLLLLAILASGLFRRLALPYSVMLVIIGLGLAQWSEHWSALAPLRQFRLTPELVFFIFLPTLVFESGLNLDARQLLKNLAPILSLAVPALLLSSAIIGLGLWALLGLELPVALLFGALISATDPVAVVALFKEIGAPRRLNILVEGESLFNDATAIVLFGILLGLVVSGEGMSLTGAGLAALDFLWVFFGGTLVGGGLALLLCELQSRLRIAIDGILALSLVMAYASFILAEHLLHVSGVMACVGAALVLGSYGVNRLPQGAEQSLGEVWEFLALVANSLLFLLVGLSIDVGDLWQQAGAIGLAVALVLLARAAGLYSLVPLTTRLFRLPPVSRHEQHIMWWGGLKGGLAIAIALSIPEQVAAREMLISLTLGVVLFTLLVNAPSIRPLMRYLGMDRLGPDEQAEIQQAKELVRDSARQRLREFQALGLLGPSNAERLEGQIQAEFADQQPRQRPELASRQAYLLALHTELNRLEELFHLGLIDQYSYLDIRHILLIDRDRHDGQADANARDLPPAQVSIFVRLERQILRWLRERNWATGLLSRYQLLRLEHRLQRDIAGVLLCHSVLERLSEAGHLQGEELDRLNRLYHQRLQRRSERLAEIRASFPLLHELFERSAFSRAAFQAALLRLRQELHHGQIGAKAYQRLSGQLQGLIDQLSKPHLQLDHDAPLPWLRQVPLFATLSRPALEALSTKVREQTYLRNDIIIGEGEHGDALYIIKQGQVRVLHQGETLADLGDKEFFGETALLGQSTRTATVQAQCPTQLWRLTRQDVLELADEYQEIAAQLEQAKTERRL